MVDPVSSFGSDAWLPHVKDLFSEYLKNLQRRPGGKFLKLREEIIGSEGKWGILVEDYHGMVEEFKVEIFGAAASRSYIDCHKIAAIYIKSLLIHKPFFNDRPDETKFFEVSWYCKLANEFFVLPYLETVFVAWTGHIDYRLRILPKYRNSFIKLLHHYLCEPESLDILSLANIIYLIEQLFFKPLV
jgi:hypothetical protein